MNIFDGAKFGDQFITRDGRLAIYLRLFYEGDKPDGSHWVVIEGCLPARYTKSGDLIGSDKISDDIVSRCCKKQLNISGEEIRQEANRREESCPKGMKESFYYGFREGAKWALRKLSTD